MNEDYYDILVEGMMENLKKQPVREYTPKVEEYTYIQPSRQCGKPTIAFYNLILYLKMQYPNDSKYLDEIFKMYYDGDGK